MAECAKCPKDIEPRSHPGSAKQKPAYAPSGAPRSGGGKRYYLKPTALDSTLLEHGGGNFHEPGDVSALHIVDGTVFLPAVFNALLVDR